MPLPENFNVKLNGPVAIYLCNFCMLLNAKKNLFVVVGRSIASATAYVRPLYFTIALKILGTLLLTSIYRHSRNFVPYAYVALAATAKLLAMSRKCPLGLTGRTEGVYRDKGIDTPKLPKSDLTTDAEYVDNLV